MLDTYTVIGFIGALVLMVGFLMNQIGRWETNDFEYDFINFIGAILLAIYAWQIGSYPFLILFVVWTVFSFKDIIGDGVYNMIWKKDHEKKGTVKKDMKKLEKELDK
jgi:hypothetical protein